MLFQIAWRNIWRNKPRSLIVICSIILGIWAGIFILALAWGIYKNNIDDTIYKQLSHIQIHHPKFLEENDAKYTILNTTEILKKLQYDSRIKFISPRVITNGMIASPTTTSGVKVYGILPKREKFQISLDKSLIMGSYFNSGKENEILIGEKLAKKHNVKLKSKLVITFTNSHSELVSSAFRVGGIYKTKNTSLDEVTVYVQQDYLRTLLDLKRTESNEIAILLKSNEHVNSIKNLCSNLIPNVKIEDWKELSPELSLVIESFNLYTFIIIGIILLALTFGIINTMLMSILERIRELGMLMAIGLNKQKIFTMIMLETLYLTLIGCPIGLLIGWLTITYVGVIGIDLSMFSEGLSSYGFRSVIYPSIDSQYYFTIMIMCFITALLSAIYPAYKALQLNPSEAIRKI